MKDSADSKCVDALNNSCGKNANNELCKNDEKKEVGVFGFALSGSKLTDSSILKQLMEDIE